MTTTYTYDYAGRVSNLTNKLTSSTTYSTHAYTYDNSGNVTKKVDTIQGTAKTTNYTYDSENRLKSETFSGVTTTYAYDVYNNLESEINNNEKYYGYDNNNRLTLIEEYGTKHKTANGDIVSDWSTYFDYDKNGNLTLNELCNMKNENHGSEKTYTYDTWGRLIGFNDNLGETTSYSYYSDGLRATKIVGIETTRYYYNGDNVINEVVNGNNYATNVMGADGYVSRKQNGTTGYLFKDAHGDVISAYSSTTNKLADYTYDAWGEQLTTGTQTWGASNPIRYNGQYYDSESGMTYLRARYYDSAIRRFITEDPIKDGVNWYSYAGNNPVMFVDPSGLYDREKAVEYAKKYSIFSKQNQWTQTFDDGKPPVRFSQDCTNFVSWCLAAGRLHSSDDWYYNFTFGNGDYVWGSYSATWSNSEEQFKAFTNCTGEFPNSNYANGNAICIHESRWIPDAIKNYNIQKGDLLYFLDPNTQKMGHTAIIVSVDNGRIIYAQHDDDKNDGDLGKYLDANIDNPSAYTYVFVVRIRDDA